MARRLGFLGLLVASLAVGVSRPAQASAFLTMTSGTSSVSCDTGFAINAGSNCLVTDGFILANDALNKIIFSADFAGYSLASATVTGSQNAANGHVTDAKADVQNVSAASDLSFLFGVYNFSLPTGPNLNFSSSQTANWASSAPTDTSAFTGYALDTNTKLPGGVAAVTPTIVSPGGDTVGLGSNSPNLLFTRTLPFYSLVGLESIHLAANSVGSFTASSTVVSAVPEPGSLILLGSCLLALGSAARRKIRKA